MKRSDNEGHSARSRLWDRQSEALEAWITAGYRGIVSAATGTGKTFLAIAAIEEVTEASDGNARVLAGSCLCRGLTVDA